MIKLFFRLLHLKSEKTEVNIVNTFIDDKIRVFDTEKGKITFESSKFKAKIMAFEMDAIEPIAYFTLHTAHCKLER